MRSTSPRLWVLIGAIALFSAGCKDDDAKGWPDGWTLPEGGLLDITYPDLGLLPDGLDYSPDGPKIQILKPKNGETILGDVLAVEAKITDPTTVNPGKVELFYKAVTVEGKTVDKKQSMTFKSGVVDVYESKLDVAAYVSLRLWITAEDMDQNKNTSESVAVERDAGPSVGFLLPPDKSSHKGSVAVQIQVSDKTGVTQFKLTIGTVDVTSKLKNTSSDPKLHKWGGSIEFDDPDFSPPLSGTQVLTARAENKNKAVSQETRTFIVDDQGPAISILSQKAGELVGGLIDVKANVTDPAGVLASSVKVVIGNNQDTRTVLLKPTGSGSKTYEAQFDTRTLTQSDLWPVMSFRAADKLGNESHQDIQVGLDNGQPIVALDPPEDYHIAKKEKGVITCSQPFDPVGPMAASDRQKVPQVQFLRARIEDRGNESTVPSAPWVPIATVNPSTVWLYVLDDTKQALVVDSDGDGYCDDINPNVIPKGTAPQKGEAVAVNMAPIASTGTADFQSTTAPAPAGCDSWGTAKDPPDNLCLPVLATYITYYTNQKEPSIYTIPPVSSGGYECLGLPFDFGANMIDDGWACVASVAKDKLGNRGVSVPMRVWVDKKYIPANPGTYVPAPGGTAPGCTGTLKKDGTVDMSKPCKFKDRRAGAGCGRKCSSCAGGGKCPLMVFPQTYCHCEVWLQS